MGKKSVQKYADEVNRLAPEIMKQIIRRQSNELTNGKITMPQFLVLEILLNKGESKMTDIAKFMNVSTAAMTGIADRIIRTGYIKRIRGKKDRRIVNLSVTKKGASLCRRIRSERRKTIYGIFKNLTENERKSYVKILRKIYGILNKKASK